MDDYSLVVQSKKGNQQAQLMLFNKYHNYLVKKYNSLRRQNNTSILFNEFEDFEAEAFLYFLDALEYTDLSKIYDRKRWKFLTPFMYFISNMSTNFLSQERLDVLSLNEKVRFGNREEWDRAEYVDFIKFNNEDDPIPRQIIEKMEYESFINTLNREEKIIINRMNQGGKRPTLLQLAGQFGISRAWMALKLKGLKEKYRQFISY